MGAHLDRAISAAYAGCEGLTLDIDALWAEVDRIDPAAPAEPPHENG